VHLVAPLPTVNDAMAQTSLGKRLPGGANARRKHRLLAGMLILAVAAAGRVSAAQSSIPRTRGVWGLKSGSQYSPGIHLGALYYYYFSNTLIDKDGVGVSQRLRKQTAAPAILYVSPKPIFGTYWGVIAASLFQRAVSSTGLNAKWGLSDTYVQPVYLGWNLARLDATAGLAFVAPTGRFRVDANDNIGLGMWSYALDGGVTVYPDSAKQWNLATIATFNTNSSIRGSDRKTGNVLMLEGGAGHSLLKKGVAGIVYYAQWKVSDDKNIPITRDPRFDARHRYYALGPEVTVPLPFKAPMILQARYFFEIGNRVATQGDAIWVLFVYNKPPSAKPAKPPR
jgi:hypothetical protein